MDDYHTTKKDIMNGLEVNPQERNRLKDEDIYEELVSEFDSVSISGLTVEMEEIFKIGRTSNILPGILQCLLSCDGKSTESLVLSVR